MSVVYPTGDWERFKIANIGAPNIIDTTTWEQIKIYSGDSLSGTTLKTSHKTLYIQMEDGSYETVSREDLIKYIGEQKLIRENELVREMYERYQVTVKLVRSDDNDHTGV